MANHLALYSNTTTYNYELSNGTIIRPNVSYCEDTLEVHYNPNIYVLTPKQIVESAYSFIRSFYEKFLIHKQEHESSEEEKIMYLNNVETAVGRKFQILKNTKNLRYLGVDLQGQSITTIYTTDNEVFDLRIQGSFHLDTIRFTNGAEYIEVYVSLYKTDEIYNGNDVFHITYLYITGGDCSDPDQMVAVAENIAYYGENMVLLSPHNTYANVTIAYPTGNGEYTTTKPASITLTPTIIDDTLYLDPEWISLTLFDYQNQEINTRVDAAITAAKAAFYNCLDGDFSTLSTLDDIKIEVPKDVFKIIKNPWTYLNEEEVFSGQQST